MFFIGLRQQSSPPHYRSRREAHLVTLWETTQERSLIFLANPDSIMCLTRAAATTSLFGITTLTGSGTAILVATTVSFTTATVSSPISDSFDLATLTIGIPSITTTDILTIILIMTSGRFTMTGIRAISPWWYKPNLHGAATIAGRSMA